MPGPCSRRRTWSWEMALLISDCAPPRRMMATSCAPETASVRVKPAPMARNASSTITTKAIATTVESDSQSRSEMLFKLIVVTAPIWRRSERMGQPTGSKALVKYDWSSTMADSAPVDDPEGFGCKNQRRRSETKVQDKGPMAQMADGGASAIPVWELRGPRRMS